LKPSRALNRAFELYPIRFYSINFFIIIIMQLVALLILSLVAVSMALPTQTGGGCPGGYAEGAEIERGRLIYVCQGSSVVPKGCIAEDLTRIPVGGHYDNGKYRRTCQTSGDGLSFEATGCVANGQEHKAGENFDDGSSFYLCKLNAADAEPAMVAVVQGCVDGGKRVPLKEKTNKDDAVYECQEAVSGGAKLVKAGCVKNGKTLAAGESVEDGKFWFNCSKSGRETFSLKAGGCIANGKRLNDGDRYTENDVIFECTIDANKNDVRAVACQSEGSVERKLGCTWVEGTAPIQYEWRCVHDAAANSAKKVQVRCNYNVGGGIYNIEPGCYRVVDKGFAGCSQSGASLSLQSYPDEQAATGAGLHAC
jgi:hypothetical protein